MARTELFLIAAFASAWAYVIVRATSVAFVHDESITYGIIHGDPTFVGQANNHWLNTLAMRIAQRLFGQSEFALRLPNVLAFVVYGAAILVVLWRRKLPAKIVGLVLLIGNPFLLEFFGLARGYGLGLAFAAVVVCAVAVEGRDTSRVMVVALAGVLAFYSYFGTLDIVLAAFVTIAASTIRRRWRDARHVIAVIGPLVVGGVVMLPGLAHLKAMQDTGLLYAGGHRGFVPDTIGSLLLFSAGAGPERPWLPFAEFVVVVVALLCVVQLVLVREWTSSALVTAVLLVAVAGQIFESVALGSLWPQDRGALVYVVPFAFMVALTVDALRAPSVAWSPVAVASAIILGNLATQANVSSATVWRYDETSRSVMEAVASFAVRVGRPDRPWKLLSGFPRQQALDYYRLSRHMTYVLPMTREPVTGDADLYYVDRWQPVIGTETVASFPATQTELRAKVTLINRVT